MKPILFNTEMVRAILDGRKSVTRQVIKPQPEGAHTILDCDDEAHTFDLLCGNGGDGGIFLEWAETVKAPYWPGDVLYVRETWMKLWYVDPNGYTHYDQPMYYYAADGTPDITLMDEDGVALDDQRIRWNPSIHMPKETARLFLRVTDVRVERLQSILCGDMRREGIIPETVTGGQWQQWQREYMKPAWNKTIKPADRDRHGWAANPWVWVIEFEQISQEEACQ